MIGIISILDGSQEGLSPMQSTLLPDNLEEASQWQFQAVPTAAFPANNAKGGAVKNEDVRQKVYTICGHLKDGVEFLDAQERALHEIIHVVQNIGQLVAKRDASHFPRKPETHLEAEFHLLLQQMGSLRQQNHFGKPLFGNSGTPSLRIYTSFCDVQRFEEVPIADMEALHLRMLYWGRVAGDGTKAIISRDTVEFALKHLLEVTLDCQKHRDRLKHVHQELAHCLQPQQAGSSIDQAIAESETPAAESGSVKLQNKSPGILQTLKSKFLSLKGNHHQ